MPGQRIRIPKTCEHCGETFMARTDHPARFCSQRCNGAHRKGTGETLLSLTCAACGAEFKRWRAQTPESGVVYCSTVCMGIGNKMTVEKFWELVDQSGGPDACWPFRGKIEGGYGRVMIDGRVVGAHRLALELTIGKTLPSDIFACHNCPDGDNPACCNPAHLFPGTAKDNTQDMLRKGRAWNGRGKRGHAHTVRTT